MKQNSNRITIKLIELEPDYNQINRIGTKLNGPKPNRSRIWNRLNRNSSRQTLKTQSC